MRESLDASRLGKTLNTMQNIKVFINVTMLKNRNFCSSKNKKHHAKRQNTDVRKYCQHL